MLIKNIDDLLLFISVDASTNIASVMPYLKQSERRYIKKVLGTTVYTNLNDVYTAAPNISSMSDDDQALWTEVNIANANLAWYLYLPIANIRFSEKGLVTSSTQESQQITKWMFDQAHNTLKEIGYNALDSLYDFLASSVDASWYTDWAAGSGFSDYKDILVNSATICSNLTPVNNSRWIYTQMRPHLKSAEQTFMRPNIGDAFFDDLKTKFRNAGGTDLEKDIIAAMQDIISMIGYSKAIKDPNIRQEITVMQGSQMDGIAATGSNRADVDNRASFDRIANQYAAEAGQLMDSLRDKLNANATSTILPLYFTSNFYKSPTDTSYTEIMNNDSSKTFWLG